MPLRTPIALCAATGCCSPPIVIALCVSVPALPYPSLPMPNKYNLKACRYACMIGR